jgi:hypothetical protein
VKLLYMYVPQQTAVNAIPTSPVCEGVMCKGEM